MSIPQMLEMYLKVPFVQRALIVGLLIALSSSLLGVTLVLKRFSFIGDGLSHVAFGAMAVAGVLQPVLKNAAIASTMANMSRYMNIFLPIRFFNLLVLR